MWRVYVPTKLRKDLRPRFPVSAREAINAALRTHQGYLTDQDFEGLVGQAERTSQLIAGLIRYLQGRTPNVKRPT